METHIIKFVTKIGFLYQNESSNCLKSILNKSNIWNYNYFYHMALISVETGETIADLYTIVYGLKSNHLIDSEHRRIYVTRRHLIDAASQSTMLMIYYSYKCSLGRAILCLP